MSRTEREPGPSWLGRRLTVRIGPVAHGGHCVARHDGRVLFVRHCLPGESVLAEVTEDRGGSFCRADAIEVLEPAPERVPAPCEYAHPGGCGGCDFQHVSLAGQRQLKASVIGEQLSRLAGIEREVTVLPLTEHRPSGVEAGGEQPVTGLGWRRRIRFATTGDGQLGLRAHRSHRVVPVRHCPLGAAGVGDADALGRRWPGLVELEVAADDRGEVAVLGYRTPEAGPAEPDRRPRTQGKPAARRRGSERAALTGEQLSGPSELVYRVRTRSFRVRPAGFWQTHPAAAEAFTEAVLAGAALAPGERALDLYAGSGLFTAALADAVGNTGRVLGLEGEAAAVRAAAGNLADLGWAAVRRAPVTAGTVAEAAAELAGPDVVVLDPPRTGAGAQVLQAVLDCQPRAVVYVACDPAALARDLRTALHAGWRLAQLTGYDAFPMTHHVECVVVLRPARAAGGAGEVEPVS